MRTIGLARLRSLPWIGSTKANFARFVLIRNERRIPLVKNWSADFVIGIVELANGGVSKFKGMMEKVGRMLWEEFDDQEDAFLSKLWSEEFFLARYEAERFVIDPRERIGE